MFHLSKNPEKLSKVTQLKWNIAASIATSPVFKLVHSYLVNLLNKFLNCTNIPSFFSTWCRGLIRWVCGLSIFDNLFDSLKLSIGGNFLMSSSAIPCGAITSLASMYNARAAASDNHWNKVLGPFRPKITKTHITHPHKIVLLSL